MATVAFPSGYNLERSSVFKHDSNADVDIMDDGSFRQRLYGVTTYVEIDCRFKYLSLSDKNTLKSFLVGARDDTVTWTIDSIDYSVVIMAGHRESMTGALYNIQFTYRAEEV